METLNIENKAARVKLDEVVRKYSMDKLIEEISQVFGAEAFANGLVEGEITNCIENAVDTLDIDIHSPGGSVIDGYTLYNEILELRERGVYVTARVTLAASMASVIAMAADKIVIKKGGRMMIHEASTATQGDAEAHKNQAELLESISNEIAGIYSERTGQPLDKIRAMMKKETWLDADEAIALGFADEKFDTKPKNNAMSILDKLTKPSSVEAQERIAALEASIESHDGQIQEFQSKVEQAEAALQEAVTELDAIKNAKELAETLNAELEVKVSELENQVKNLTEEASEELAEARKRYEELEAKAEETEKKVSAKAAELLAEQGHPAPVNLEYDGAAKTSYLDTFNSLTGSAATDYFKAHRKEIRAEEKLARTKKG